MESRHTDATARLRGRNAAFFAALCLLSGCATAGAETTDSSDRQTSHGVENRTLETSSRGIEQALEVDRTARSTSQAMAATVTVIEAARHVPEGAPLSKSHVTVDEVPAAHVGRTTITRPELQRYLGVPLEADLQEGDRLQRRYFLINPEADSLAAKTPSDHRAFTLDTDEVRGTSSHLVPGDHVDLSVTFGTDGDGSLRPLTDDALETTTLELFRARVIAVDERLDSDPGAVRDDSPDSITLMVTPREAQILHQSLVNGDLAMVLRPTGVRTEKQAGELPLSELRERLESMDDASDSPEIIDASGN